MCFPSLKTAELERVELERVLRGKPLQYQVVRQTGSHRKLESPNGYPPLILAFHSSRTIPPNVVRKILVQDVGLTEEEARALL